MTDGLVAALARAQMAFPPIVKSHTNPAFKGSQYADVADVLAAVRPVLAAEGIALVQSTMTSPETGGVELITKLLLGEEYLASVFPLPVQGLTAQQVGSLLTYHRRYQLCAILGVHPVGDDDDGNLAATAAAPAEPDETPIVRALRESVRDRIAALGTAERELVKLEMRNMKMPALTRPGAVAFQLESLAEFVEGLEARNEPFPVTTNAPVSEGAARSVSTPDGDEPNAIPFNPVVVDASTESGTHRKAVNSSMKANK